MGAVFPDNRGSTAALAAYSADVDTVVNGINNAAVSSVDLGVGYSTTCNAATDGIHPNDVGTGVLAANFVPAVKALTMRSRLGVGI